MGLFSVVLADRFDRRRQIRQFFRGKVAAAGSAGKPVLIFLTPQKGRRKLLKICGALCFVASFASSYFTTFKNRPTSPSKLVYVMTVEPIYALFSASTLLCSAMSRRASSQGKDGNPQISPDMNGNGYSSRQLPNRQSKVTTIDLRGIFGKVLRGAYFTHYAVITWIFGTTREPLAYISFNYVSRRFVFRNPINILSSSFF